MNSLKSYLRAYWKWCLVFGLLGSAVLGYRMWRNYLPIWSCEEAVERSLAAPATAKFVSTEILEEHEQEGKHFYFGYVIVDAQNQYGALLRGSYCVIVYQDEQYRFHSTGIDGVIDCKRPPLMAEERTAQKRLVGWQ